MKTRPADLDGEAMTPDSPGYEQARRVWNGMIDRHPGLVIACESERDVVSTVRFAGETGGDLAVRCGGHAVAGFSTCDGGVVLDLSRVRHVNVDPERRIARVGGGARWADLDAAAAQHGLATTGGLVSTTGVAGLTLGGGIGWLVRPHGLACDNLVSARVVTAAGTVVEASESSDPELLWGLRGGGGNFGVVTEFEFRLHPVSTVTGGFALFPVQRAAEVGSFYREWVRDHPDEFTSMLVALIGPDVEEIPADLRRQPCLAIMGCHVGTPQEADRLLAPVRRLGPGLDGFGLQAYVDLQKMFDADYPPGRRAYFNGLYTADVPERLIGILSEAIAGAPSAGCEIDVHHMGGAAGRVPTDATAFSGRQAGFTYNVYACWDSPEADDVHRDWARGVVRSLQPFRLGGEYVNFATDVRDTGEAAYGRDRYQRLVALKRRYDPQNLFHLNHNIRP